MKNKTGKSNIDIVRSYLDGERPFVQVGYAGEKNKYRVEGEKWTDSDGVEWERKDGKTVRITKTQGDIIREALKQKCDCGQNIKWGSKLDQYFYARTGLCENCLITYETNLRILGIYNFYERFKMASYEYGRLREAKKMIEEVIKYFSENSGDVQVVCNSEGFLERWQNTNKDKILEDANKDLKSVDEKIEHITKIVEEAKQFYIENSNKYKVKAYV